MVISDLTEKDKKRLRNLTLYIALTSPFIKVIYAILLFLNLGFFIFYCTYYGAINAFIFTFNLMIVPNLFSILVITFSILFYLIMWHFRKRKLPQRSIIFLTKEENIDTSIFHDLNIKISYDTYIKSRSIYLRQYKYALEYDDSYILYSGIFSFYINLFKEKIPRYTVIKKKNLTLQQKEIIRNHVINWKVVKY